MVLPQREYLRCARRTVGLAATLTTAITRDAALSRARIATPVESVESEHHQRRHNHAADERRQQHDRPEVAAAGGKGGPRKFFLVAEII